MVLFKKSNPQNFDISPNFQRYWNSNSKANHWVHCEQRSASVVLHFPPSLLHWHCWISTNKAASVATSWRPQILSATTYYGMSSLPLGFWVSVVHSLNQVSKGTFRLRGVPALWSRQPTSQPTTARAQATYKVPFVNDFRFSSPFELNIHSQSGCLHTFFSQSLSLQYPFSPCSALLKAVSPLFCVTFEAQFPLTQ